ncbi:Beta-4C adrenergic receptor [Trichoplax sp. H2]|uniref:G-protein coupled receptors family 1 profile domain-containing protein n=1 Tax=Trichoplax adhaerens TaxID=10228 RepID=B3RW16_TRIAD|nr:hypothetical protein TRIADDRAFT_55852 [Trichoplax adhaerens]EDV26097.1 hypothetical protein TRIADDRAFT_55852 [Trichoplax adhaerens]RDD38280.1 Beta-4C adrenergic receptor [Trichoplax sp. H2]|eukprot:XP_002112130.1 hypothetical protein TRIADDRAFT_55852 [Trichoplax adhaerens]
MMENHSEVDNRSTGSLLSLSNTTNSDNVMRELPQIIYYEIIGFTALLTNGFLVYLILTRKRLWKIQNVKLCSMSMSGILFAILFCLPYPLVVMDPTNILCYLKTSLRNFLMSCMCLHLALIAIDRAITVGMPFHFSNFVNRRTTWIYLTLVWVMALIGSFYPVLTFRTVKRDDKNPCTTSGDAGDELIYNIFFYSFCYLCPLKIMLICHGYIFIIALRHLKQMNNEQYPSFDPVQRRKSQLITKQFKAAVPLIIITGTFILLTLPYIICSMIALILGSSPLKLRLRFIRLIVNCLRASEYGLRELAFAYPALNPLLYIWLSRDIRSEIIEMCKRPLVRIPISGTKTSALRLAIC